MKVYITKGLSGSGKSTWASQMVEESNGRIKRINKDDLRAMLDRSKWSKANERFIVKVRNRILLDALRAGFDVIVDDTNLNPVHEREIRKIVTPQTEIEIVSFLDVPIEVCIERDAQRTGIAHVGEKVIRRQAADYERWKNVVPELDATGEPYVADPNLPKAILVDIDGTIAHMSGRSPFEWHRVGEDSPDEIVADTVRLHHDAGYVIVFMSGRDASCREETIDWLKRHNLYSDVLFMRPEGDQRKDNIVKLELFDKNVRHNFNVRFVLDDRQQVVDMWRELGLKVYHVDYGDF